MARSIPEKSSYPALEEGTLAFWKEHRVFEESLALRADAKPFVFFEGPPTANGKPGVHHVIARTIKDLVCRYKTMTGHRVDRKAGWDTHGLPVEIEVERRLKLESKDKIVAYGIDKFNATCRESVFTYLKEWNELTERIGYWLDLKNPYVTLNNEYIETVWWILAQFFERGLLYEGHKIVPYCPRCQTGLSSHEVAQGYQEVDDPSITITMPLVDEPDVSYLVWTTTPWTLISNTAVAVGADIDYVKVRHDDKMVILAAARAEAVLGDDFEVLERFKGEALLGRKYKPPFDFFAEHGDVAFTTLAADFVSTEDGTGIVHMAPAFGADDYELGRQHGLPVIQPVTTSATFSEKITPYAGQYIKDADKQITRDLREAGRLFASGTVRHNYPFCWRCDSALIYYARKSWYIRTSEFRERFAALNSRINWYPPEIGSGRFGEWLENNVDWAISRERFWGTPLPIWTCTQCEEKLAVDSVATLRDLATARLPEPIDLHRPYVDDVELACPQCKGALKRAPEVIDVWFDSGSMPFAQWHYPFENADKFDALFPGDFISEAVDQTRGWFYSLVAIAAMLKDQPCFRNCLVMEFIVDKHGKKMSKSKGSFVEPGEVIERYGADALRWYLITVSQPWTATRFDPAGVGEVQNRFFDTWRNTYAFLALYAGIDSVEVADLLDRPTEANEFDRWLASRCASVARTVREYLEKYDLTRAARAVADFAVDDLSNWYLRLNRRRFWGEGVSDDKKDAYASLGRALLTIAKLAAPVAPFFSEAVYRGLMENRDDAPASVHLCDFPDVDEGAIDVALETRMAAAQKIVSLGRAARGQARLKVRQPLASCEVVRPPELEEGVIQSMTSVIAEELNVKQVGVRAEGAGLVEYAVKPNFKALGPRVGKRMKELQQILTGWGDDAVESYRRTGAAQVPLGTEKLSLGPQDLAVDITAPEGYFAAADGRWVVVLDGRMTDELLAEGWARELINKIQHTRKEEGLAVTDRVRVTLQTSEPVKQSLERHRERVMRETLATEIVTDGVADGKGKEWDLNGEPARIALETVDTA